MKTKTNNNFDSRLRDIMGATDFEKAIKDTEFALDFGGFYESIHTEYIDKHIEDLNIYWVDVDYKKHMKIMLSVLLIILTFHLIKN